jgi:hypothetical protein
VPPWRVAGQLYFFTLRNEPQYSPIYGEVTEGTKEILDKLNPKPAFFKMLTTEINLIWHDDVLVGFGAVYTRR